MEEGTVSENDVNQSKEDSPAKTGSGFCRDMHGVAAGKEDKNMSGRNAIPEIGKKIEKASANCERLAGRGSHALFQHPAGVF